MHSRIIQLGVSPIHEEDYIQEHSVPDWFFEIVADYVDESNRKVDIQGLKHCLSDSERYAEWDENAGTMTINDVKSFQDTYFKQRFTQLQELVSTFTLQDFTESHNAYALSSLIKERFGFYIYDGSTLMPLDSFVRSLPHYSDTTFYIGGTLDYHF